METAYPIFSLAIIIVFFVYYFSYIYTSETSKGGGDVTDFKDKSMLADDPKQLPGVLMDVDIKELCQGGNNMIVPFVDKPVRFLDSGKNVISFGLSSAGYDVRLKAEGKIFSNVSGRLVDPKDFDKENLVDAKIYEENGSKYIVLPPHSYLLAPTMEYFHIPDNIIVICLGKSTYCRSAIAVNVSPIEPGFEGEVVIELFNSCSIPVKIYLEEGIAQFIFLRGKGDCEVSYQDKNGKYQKQTGIRLSQG